MDITLGELLEISPIARMTFKEGMPVVKRNGRVKDQVAARMQPPNKSLDVKAVQIKTTIVDKVVPNVRVGRGSGLNILTAQTMVKLKFSLIDLSSSLFIWQTRLRRCPWDKLRTVGYHRGKGVCGNFSRH